MGLFSETLQNAQKKMQWAESIKRIDEEGYKVLTSEAKADIAVVHEWIQMSKEVS